jgi:hypothetical protein
MQLDGLDYNTGREKLRLKAYGRNIQQLVESCMSLPTKRERQLCAEEIISIMRRTIPSTQNQKDRMPVLWYHLALMSDFKLDIDYPVEIVREDKMATAPDRIEYTNKRRMPIRHYGRLLFEMFQQLKEMPEGPARDRLVQVTAGQMYRSLVMWGMATADKEKVASDLARFTDGAIQIDPKDLRFEVANGSNKRKKKKK